MDVSYNPSMLERCITCCPVLSLFSVFIAFSSIYRFCPPVTFLVFSASAVLLIRSLVGFSPRWWPASRCITRFLASRGFLPPLSSDEGLSSRLPSSFWKRPSCQSRPYVLSSWALVVSVSWCNNQVQGWDRGSEISSLPYFRKMFWLKFGTLGDIELCFLLHKSHFFNH